jgi:hypothetical protein
MSLPSRIALTIALAALAGGSAFVAHGCILFGFDFFSFELPVIYGIALIATVLVSVVLLPVLFLVERFLPVSIRRGLAIAIALLVALCVATWHLTSYKHYPLELDWLIGRAWNVYMYYSVLGLTFGTSWAILVTGRIRWPASAQAGRA